MPFTPKNKNTGDLLEANDWNEALAAIAELFAKFDRSSGHRHSGTDEDAPPLTSSGLANGAVTNAKIADNTITASKMANGVIPANIGVSITKGMSDGQSIPIPQGFSRSECLFYASIKFINLGQGGPTYNCDVDQQTGRVTLSAGLIAIGMALGKKGGW